MSRAPRVGSRGVRGATGRREGRHALLVSPGECWGERHAKERGGEGEACARVVLKHEWRSSSYHVLTIRHTMLQTRQVRKGWVGGVCACKLNRVESTNMQRGVKVILYQIIKKWYNGKVLVRRCNKMRSIVSPTNVNGIIIKELDIVRHRETNMSPSVDCYM